jgi:hypothetical protein
MEEPWRNYLARAKARQGKARGQRPNLTIFGVTNQAPLFVGWLSSHRQVTNDAYLLGVSPPDRSILELLPDKTMEASLVVVM